MQQSANHQKVEFEESSKYIKEKAPCLSKLDF